MAEWADRRGEGGSVEERESRAGVGSSRVPRFGCCHRTETHLYFHTSFLYRIRDTTRKHVPPRDDANSSLTALLRLVRDQQDETVSAHKGRGVMRHSDASAAAGKAGSRCQSHLTIDTTRLPTLTTLHLPHSNPCALLSTLPSLPSSLSQSLHAGAAHDVAA